MNSARHKICLVTPGHVSSTPRLVKEADALSEAGYDVRVVAARHFPPVDPLDNSLLKNAAWRCTRVDACGRARTLPWKCLRCLARFLVRRLPNPGIWLAGLAQDAVSPRILRAAAAEHADLYIAHCLGAFPAVALAARKRRALYGFDIEDYHDGETTGAMATPALAATTRLLQSRLLPGARYLTASAPMIAEQYAKSYGARANVVLNVFPRNEAPLRRETPGVISDATPAILYWFSQTVGGDRGLEEVLLMIGRMRTPAALCLRGFVSPNYRDHLMRLAAENGVRHPPIFLPPEDPREMARLSASAHAGICAERPTVPNHDLCLANKIFTYLLAGVPALLSPTRAHIAIAQELGCAARILPLSAPAEAALVLDRLLENPSAQAEARDAAWRLAQTKYCWDLEKTIVLENVAAALRATQ